MSAITQQPVKSYSKLFIGGTLGDTFERPNDRRRLPGHRGGHRAGAGGPARGRRRAVAAAAQGVRRRPVAAHVARRARRRAHARARRGGGALRGDVAGVHARDRRTAASSAISSTRTRWTCGTTRPRSPRPPLRGDPRRARRRRAARRARAGRRRRHDHPVERSGRHGVAEDRPGAGGRLHGGPQAGARGSGQRDDAGRGDRGGRAAARAWSTSCRQAARSASISSATPVWTRSPSPAAPQRASAS